MAPFADPLAKHFWDPYIALGGVPYDLRREKVFDVFLVSPMGNQEQLARQHFLELDTRVGWDLLHLYYPPLLAGQDGRYHGLKAMLSNGTRVGAIPQLAEIYGPGSAQYCHANAVYWTWTALDHTGDGNERISAWRRAIAYWILVERSGFLLQILNEPVYQKYSGRRPDSSIIWHVLEACLQDALEDCAERNSWLLHFNSLRQGMEELLNTGIVHDPDVVKALSTNSIDSQLKRNRLQSTWGALLDLAEQHSYISRALCLLSYLGPSYWMAEHGDCNSARQYLEQHESAVPEEIRNSVDFYISILDPTTAPKLIDGSLIAPLGFASNREWFSSSQIVTQELNQRLIAEIEIRDLRPIARQLEALRVRYGVVRLWDRNADSIVDLFNHQEQLPDCSLEGNALSCSLTQLECDINLLNGCLEHPDIQSLPAFIARVGADLGQCDDAAVAYQAALSRRQEAIQRLLENGWQELSQWHPNLDALRLALDNVKELLNLNALEVNAVNQKRTWLAQQQDTLKIHRCQLLSAGGLVPAIQPLVVERQLAKPASKRLTTFARAILFGAILVIITILIIWLGKH